MEHVPASHVWWHRRVVSFDVENDRGKYHLRFCDGFVAQHLKAQVLSASLWCLLGPFPATITLLHHKLLPTLFNLNMVHNLTCSSMVLHIPIQTCFFVFLLALQERASDPRVSYHSQNYNPAPPSSISSHTVDGRNIDILHQLVNGLSR